MRIALIQQHTTSDRGENLDLAAVGRSHARRLFLRDRRPELYPQLLGFPEDS